MSGAEPTQPPVARCEGVTPILRGRSHQASIDHYVRVLGFTLAWNDAGVMASVSRDRADIMRCEGDQGNPGTWLWIGVDDTAALLAECTGSGATIRLAPTSYPWACEMHGEDPDGHVLRFGSEPREDRPFSAWVEWYGRAS